MPQFYELICKTVKIPELTRIGIYGGIRGHGTGDSRVQRRGEIEKAIKTGDVEKSDNDTHAAERGIELMGKYRQFMGFVDRETGKKTLELHFIPETAGPKKNPQ